MYVASLEVNLGQTMFLFGRECFTVGSIVVSLSDTLLSNTLPYTRMPVQLWDCVLRSTMVIRNLSYTNLQNDCADGQHSHTP